MKNTIKRAAVVLLASSTLMAVQPALAVDEHNVVPGLTAAGAPLALHGIDPVASIELGNRIEGAATHTAIHDGVAYYFSSAANQQTFERKPERYIPQNGGFCTFGVSVGKKFDGDPNYADVVVGKLYVFLNEDIFKMYQKDAKGTIKKARNQWRKIKHTAASEL